MPTDKSFESDEFVVDNIVDKDYEPEEVPGPSSSTRPKRFTRSTKSKAGKSTKKPVDDDSTDEDNEEEKRKNLEIQKRKRKIKNKVIKSPKPAMRKSVAKMRSKAGIDEKPKKENNEDPDYIPTDSSSNSDVLPPKRPIPKKYAHLRNISDIEDLQEGTIVKVVNDDGSGLRIDRITRQVTIKNIDEFDDDARDRMLKQMGKETVVVIDKNDICSIDGKPRSREDLDSDSSHDSDIKIVSDDYNEFNLDKNFILSEDDIAYNDAQTKIKEEVHNDEDYDAAIVRGRWVKQQKSGTPFVTTNTEEDQTLVQSEVDDVQESGVDDKAASSPGGLEEDSNKDEEDMGNDWMVKVNSEIFEEKDDNDATDEPTVKDEEISNPDSDSDASIVISTPNDKSEDDE